MLSQHTLNENKNIRLYNQIISPTLTGPSPSSRGDVYAFHFPSARWMSWLSRYLWLQRRAVELSLWMRCKCRIQFTDQWRSCNTGWDISVIFSLHVDREWGRQSRPLFLRERYYSYGWCSVWPCWILRQAFYYQFIIPVSQRSNPVSYSLVEMWHYKVTWKDKLIPFVMVNAFAESWGNDWMIMHKIGDSSYD